MMKSLIGFLLLYVGAIQAQNAFDYQRPDTWPDNCANTQAMRQTPINIVTSETVANDTLGDLQFDERWSELLDGTFLNSGLGVRFIADGEAATVDNHLGTYILRNVHFHWGPEDNNGTGHQFDGESFGVELHFVTTREGADLSNLGPDTEDASVAVISVLAEAVDRPITGVWDELDPTMVIDDGNSSDVSGISWSMLLPNNRNYYYYRGSQTSPGCWEFVHWFVMRNTIPVPSDYLAQLRMTRFDSGDLITLNHRPVQPLNDRTVYRGGVDARAVVKPLLIILSVFTLYFLID